MAGVFLIGEDRKVLAINDPLLTFLGVDDRAAILGKSFLEGLPERERETVSAVYQMVMESGEPVLFGFDGVGSVAVPLVEESGKVLCLVIVFFDESPLWQCFLFPLAVFFQDLLGNIIAVSESFRETFHPKGSGLFFDPEFASYLSPVELPRMRRDFSRLLRGKPILNAPYVFRDAFGNPFPASLTAFSLYGKDGELSGGVNYILPSRAFHRDATAVFQEVLTELRGIEKSLSKLVPVQQKSSRMALLAKLTPREVEVLRFLAEGYSVRETAKMLDVSPNTVETHRRSILRKLNLPSMAHLVRAAVAFGLVLEDPWE